MGLDMYAYRVDDEMHPLSPEGENELDDCAFYWRKHSKLHQFMNDYYHEEAEKGNIVVSDDHKEQMWSGEFNCIPLYLPMDKLFELKYLIEDDDLPESGGGFFWGDDFQDQSAQEYKEQDLKFCNWAIDETDKGNFIYYSCWF